MAIEVNTIKEIFRGHYQVILDYPTPKDLIKILDVSYKYIWGFDHKESLFNWTKDTHSIFDKACKVDVRNITMEFLINTSLFLELIPFIHQAVNLIQTNIVPPSYLNITALKGKGRYDLLKDKVDYLFEISMPGASDYTPIVSPNLDFLKRVIERMT